MPKTDAKYIHALRSIPGIGNGTLATLLHYFGSGEAAWCASTADIAAIPKMYQEKKTALANGRRQINPDRLWEKLSEQEIVLHIKSDPTYPQLLRQMKDGPATFYTRGTLNWEHLPPLIAIVGSRKHSSYGMQVADKLAGDLSRAGFIVVSGMAFGIDSVAHKGALESGSETIAVLGSGIDDAFIAPVSHFSLAQKIMAHGALVSEYPPGTPATQGSFPMRDRIIAGLCCGTIVIEAGENSGSLITAQHALDYNREVFAIPGSILSPYSIGTNTLIKKGAKLVTGVQDILEEFPENTLFPAPTHQETAQSIPGLSPEEHRILSLLSHEPLHIDNIIKRTKLSAATNSALLALLEIKGLAKNVGGMHYVKVQ